MPLRRNINLPELPAELWLRIFRLATWVPDILDPDLALIISPFAIQARRKALKRSSVTKRYLVRVCKAWHSLALSFLWESIYIGKVKTLNTLCDSLRRSKGKYSYDGCHESTLGWWTKHINVFIRDSTDTTTEFQILEEIFKHLPNLTTISLGIKVSTLPGFILRSITETCGTCLQAITWSIPHTLVPELDDWLAFLANVPNIKAIRCPLDRYIDSRYLLLVGAGIKAPQLSQLNHISLFYTSHERGLMLADLPSLRHLSLERSAGGYDHLEPIFEKYGSQLETLQFDRLFDDVFLEEMSIPISDMCPNVSRLNVLVSHWEVITYDFVLPDSIEVFGIQCGVQGQASKRAYRYLFNVLCALKFGPRFRVIQIIDRAIARDLRERHRKEVIKFTKRLKMKGVELHDHEGGLLCEEELVAP